MLEEKKTFDADENTQDYDESHGEVNPLDVKLIERTLLIRGWKKVQIVKFFRLRIDQIEINYCQMSKTFGFPMDRFRMVFVKTFCNSNKIKIWFCSRYHAQADAPHGRWRLHAVIVSTRRLAPCQLQAGRHLLRIRPHIWQSPHQNPQGH